MNAHQTHKEAAAMIAKVEALRTMTDSTFKALDDARWHFEHGEFKDAAARATDALRYTLSEHSPAFKAATA